MATGKGVQVLGVKEAQAAFKRLPDVARENFNDATALTLYGIVTRATARLRSNPSILTGTLANHIGYSLNKATGFGKAGVEMASTVMTLGGRKVKVRGKVVAGRNGSALTAHGARVIRPTRYGHHVEFGHGGRSPARAEPFMMPAVRAEEPLYLQRIRAAGQQIERDMTMVGGRLL